MQYNYENLIITGISYSTIVNYILLIACTCWLIEMSHNRGSYHLLSTAVLSTQIHRTDHWLEIHSATPCVSGLIRSNQLIN